MGKKTDGPGGGGGGGGGSGVSFDRTSDNERTVEAQAIWRFKSFTAVQDDGSAIENDDSISVFKLAEEVIVLDGFIRVVTPAGAGGTFEIDALELHKDSGVVNMIESALDLKVAGAVVPISAASRGLATDMPRCVVGAIFNFAGGSGAPVVIAGIRIARPDMDGA